jgi:hypothetical protein
MSFIAMPEMSHQAPATIMIQPIILPFFMLPLPRHARCKAKARQGCLRRNGQAAPNIPAG